MSDIRWRKMKKNDLGKIEELLCSCEPLCVAACGRFLKRDPSKDLVWIRQNREGRIFAMLIRSRRDLLPVFCGTLNEAEGRSFQCTDSIPLPRFLFGFLGMPSLHSIQGLKNDVLILEKHMEKFQMQPTESFDYDLMSIDKAPHNNCFSAGPAELVLRYPRYSDMDALAALQAGYEQEEVLPKSAVFNPAASRLNMEKVFSGEQLMAAELNGQLVGKINTSALSFTRFQIGGVYVHPDYRGMGIATRMTAEFVRYLISQRRGVSLFVKKSNPAALSVYRRLGFEILADYRISYYL